MVMKTAPKMKTTPKIDTPPKYVKDLSEVNEDTQCASTTTVVLVLDLS